ncbi:MAG TPA: hypothetical protein VGN81_25175 [Pseudonocardiaceae bacterium]
MIGALSKTRLAHVRWIAGGTGAGKSTLCRILAQRYDLTVYIGDRAEHTWTPRFTKDQHPYAWATIHQTLEQRALCSPEQRFAEASSLHGETIGFVLDDLLAMPDDRPILVDWFGNTPHDVVPLLSWPEQAVFLLPTPEFRRIALTERFADSDRARATWGDTDHARALAIRLARDDLWDAEMRRQAVETGAQILLVDGSRSAEELADDVAERFRLTTDQAR